MLQLLVSKEVFENIVMEIQKTITKTATLHWKKELFDISIIENNIVYEIKKLEKIKILSEYGYDKPSIVISCENIKYDNEKKLFEFYLGKIIEKRNIEQKDKAKDLLIEQLLKEREFLKDNAKKDDLTQTFNKRKFDEDLKQFILQENKKDLSLSFVIVREFKKTAENLGNSVMIDRALRMVANRIKMHARRLNANVYRYGEEKFAMLSFMPYEQLSQSLNYIKKDVKEIKIDQNFENVFLDVDIGFAFWDGQQNLDDFLSNAHKNIC